MLWPASKKGVCKMKQSHAVDRKLTLAPHIHLKTGMTHTLRKGVKEGERERVRVV